ncbi:GGDEF domain-containing protein [Aliidiomarina indica]|uniref:GGDEF domain-containing protein n=1 Tax=Aliidiomarina indica TaxID=2749147 RepID=UPI00188EBE02|nr:diguanylate cyclase [Aliidiomarina indica]
MHELSGDARQDDHSSRILEQSSELTLFRGVLLFIGYVVLWRVSALMEYAPHASLWFPPAGWTLAAFLVFGVRALFPLALGMMFTTFWMNAIYDAGQTITEVLVVGLLFTFAISFSYGLGAALLRQFVRFGVVRDLPVMVMSFLALGALTSLLASFLGTQVLLIAGTVSIFDVYTIWLPWWIGDMAGVLVLTPLFMVLMLWRQPHLSSWVRTLRISTEPTPIYQFGVKLTVLLSLLYACILLSWWFEHRDVAFAVFFLIIPQMWIAYTENALRTAVSLGVFSLSLAIGINLFDLGESAMVYQFAVTVIAASVYFGLAVPVLLAQNQQLQMQAQFDYLTGVTTRGYFSELAADELERASHYKYPISLLMLDLDHFKRINDTYGHAVGDKALMAVADVLKNQLRPSDLCGRFGGDEFLVLLPGLSESSASKVVVRIKDAFEYIAIEGLDEPISASFGMVQIEPGESLEKALQRADEHLITGKRRR